jgi:hypothetical protein
MIPYQLFHNATAFWMRAGQVDDKYVRGHVGHIGLMADEFDGAMDVCEAIYAVHNADDRPDRLARPSLSIGDVIALNAHEALWTVDGVGFLVLPEGTGIADLQVYESFECQCTHRVNSHVRIPGNASFCLGAGELVDPSTGVRRTFCPCPQYDGPFELEQTP